MNQWEIDTFRDFLEIVLEKYPGPDERYTITPGEEDNDSDYRVGREDIDEYRDLISDTGHRLIAELVGDQYKVDSFGQTNLAHIPYIAVLNTDESQSTTYGRYVVYLVDPVRDTAYLSLGVGAHEIGEFADAIVDEGIGGQFQSEILRGIATWNRRQIEHPGFESGPIDFHDSLNRGDAYGNGTICYESYTLDDLPSVETLHDDLERLLNVYDDLIATRVDNLDVELDDRRAWQVSPGDGSYRWPGWDEAGVVSIGWGLDPDAFEENPAGLDSIDEASVGKIDGQGFAFQFVHEMSEGDIVIAARRGKTNPHTIHAIGKITATNLDETDFDVPETIDGDAHFHAVQWHDFGTGVPITLGKNIPLIAKTLTDLGADDVGHVLGTTLVSLVASGQFESVAAAVSAVVETTTMDVEVIQDTTHDELVGGGAGQSNGDDNGPNEPDCNGVPFDEADLLKPQFNRDPADIELSELYFEDETELLGEAIAALRDGNHLLFVGPPGTGKSDLARVLSEELVGENYELTTATADWSTFDTIGGYRQQEDGDLQFSPGVFLSRFQDENDRPANEWLIVDEFNRANIDKAFGSLFSVLTGDDVLLPFSEDGDDIRMYGSEPDPESIVTSTDYVVPNDWRLLATMNTFDKSSLYDLSYALSRRFSYIHVPAPTVDDIDEPLVKAYIECWDRVDPDVDRIKAITELWKAVQTERPLGPAIIRDVLVAANSDLTRGVVQHVLPQFEGLMNRTQSELLEGILETGHVDDDRIETFGQQYFGLTDWTA